MAIDISGMLQADSPPVTSAVARRQRRAMAAIDFTAPV